MFESVYIIALLCLGGISTIALFNSNDNDLAIYKLQKDNIKLKKEVKKLKKDINNIRSGLL